MRAAYLPPFDYKKNAKYDSDVLAVKHYYSIAKRGEGRGGEAIDTSTLFTSYRAIQYFLKLRCVFLLKKRKGKETKESGFQRRWSAEHLRRKTLSTTGLSPAKKIENIILSECHVPAANMHIRICIYSRSCTSNNNIIAHPRTKTCFFSHVGARVVKRARVMIQNHTRPPAP